MQGGWVRHWSRDKRVSGGWPGQTRCESEIVVLLKQIGVYAGKKEGFGRRRSKNEIEKKRKCRDYH